MPRPKKPKEITKLNDELLDAIYAIWKAKNLSPEERKEMLCDAVTEIELLMGT